MNKTTETVIRAFVEGRSRKVGNTKTDGTYLYLHGRIIAVKIEGGYKLTLGGLPKAVTRERLNGLCDLIGCSHKFTQRKRSQYFGVQKIEDNTIIRVIV